MFTRLFLASTCGLSVLLAPVRSMSQDEEWVVRAGGTCGENGGHIVATPDGGAVITGLFCGEARFGSRPPLQAQGEHWDMYLVKYDSDGEVDWAESIRGTGIRDAGEGFGAATVLGDGDVVVTGSFTGTAMFGDISITSADSPQCECLEGGDMFVARFDSSEGRWLWAKSAQGSAEDGGNMIAQSSDGDVVVSGWFSTEATFGQGEENTLEGGGHFLAKYNTDDGALVWVRKIECDPDDSSYVVGLGNNGFVAAGSFSRTVSFEGDNGPPLEVDGSGAYLAKYSSDGEFLWKKEAVQIPSADDGESFVAGGTLAAYPDGSIVLIGDFGSSGETATFGGKKTLRGYDDAFVAKYDPSGDLVWVNATNGMGEEEGKGVAIVGTEGVLVTGAFEGKVAFGRGESADALTAGGEFDIFVAKYKAADGTLDWVHRAASSEEGEGTAIAVAAGHAFVTGNFSGTVDFWPGDQNGPLKSVGGDDIFVAKLKVASEGVTFLRGDCNSDGTIDIADPVFLLNGLFGGGPLSTCPEATDVNDDRGVNIADPIYLLNRLFGGGSPIPPPNPNCGPDPELPGLGCESFKPCM